MLLTLHLATTNELLERARYVREQVFTIEKQIPKSIEVDELDCLNDACDHFVVEIKDAKELGELQEAVVGTKPQEMDAVLCQTMDVCALRCKKIDEKTIQLQRFCVLQDYRKTGVGRWVLEQIEDYYWKQGVEIITLDAKFRVSEFYEKCGYLVVSEPFIEADVLHVVMEKRRGQE